MSILIDEHTRVLVQGITGGEGMRACAEMLRFGTKVCAGVTPGKGGQEVYGVPVFNSVVEALEKYPEIQTTVVMVPAQFATAATLEALEAGISLLVLFTEHITTRDVAILIAKSEAAGARLVGPSSVGIVSPGKSKVGSIGMNTDNVFTPGNIGVISKSGGMTSEIAHALSKAGFGQSTAIGIGSDILMGSTFADVVHLFSKDPDTHAIVIFGEVGGSYEEELATYIQETSMAKPVVALIAGAFGENLPQETTLGHAGAIVSRGKGSYASKIAALRAAGVHIVQSVEEIPILLKTLV